MGVQFQRLAIQAVADRRDERPRPFRRQQAGRVLDVDPVDIAAAGHPGSQPGVAGVVVDLAERVGERADDLLAAREPDQVRGAADGRHVVHRVEHDEPRHPVGHQPVIDQPHHLFAGGLPRDEPEPGADELERGAGHGRPGQPDPFPRILPVGPDGDAHVGAGGEVQRPEPHPVHDRGDLQDLAGGQPGRAPQALVPVPDGHVEQFDVSHAPPPPCAR